MLRRSFIGWIVSAITGAAVPSASSIAEVKRRRKWIRLTNVYGDIREVVFPEDGFWACQLIWDWQYGRTNLWPQNVDRTHWVISILGSSCESRIHYFRGSEEEAKRAAEKYTVEKIKEVLG